MTTRVRRGIVCMAMLSAVASGAWAMGRSSDDEKDPFPDYNRLEIHHTTPAPDASAPPPPSQSPAVDLPVIRSTFSDTGEDLSHPKPPPPAVPSHDESEPDLPAENSVTTSSGPGR